MRKNNFAALLVTGSAILVAVSCSDSSLGTESVIQRAAPASAAEDIAFDRARNARNFEFDIPAAGGTIDIAGLFTLNIPANAVCDLSSSYGATHWSDSCAPAGSVHVRAKVWVKRGRLHVDFKPALRFDPSAVVTISTNSLSPLLLGRSDLANGSAKLRYLGILYSSQLEGANVDEATSLRDGSLTTHVNLLSGRVWRRIKHFSGYSIITGLECDLNAGDPDCVESLVDGGGGH